MADGLRERFERLAKVRDSAEDHVLAYMTFHPDHWTKISSTDPLERLIGEIKRRTDVVGIFPNEAAIVRLFGALLLKQNDEWAVGGRYMSLETLARQATAVAAGPSTNPAGDDDRHAAPTPSADTILI